MSYPLDPQISQYIIDCKLFKRFLPPQLRVDPLNELTGCTFLCLNVYEMYILLSYIKLNFDIFEDINFDNFSEIIQYNNKLYFNNIYTPGNRDNLHPLYNVNLLLLIKIY